jgi:hypothetical protein
MSCELQAGSLPFVVSCERVFPQFLVFLLGSEDIFTPLPHS